MTYPQPRIRGTFLYTVTGTDEVAQTSIDFSSGDLDAPGLNALLDSMADEDFEDFEDAFHGLLVGGGIVWANYSNFVGSKWAVLDTSGLYTAEPSIHERGTPYTGSTNSVPPQCSVVITEWSGSTFGKGNYGRLYLPHTQMSLETGTPRATATTAETIADNAKTMVAGMNALWAALDATYPHVAIIASQEVSPTMKQVLYLRCGRLVDTQRRRRGQLDEDPQTSDIVTA